MIGKDLCRKSFWDHNLEAIQKVGRSAPAFVAPHRKFSEVTLIRDLEQYPESARGGAVSVGNFDGVHRGHAALIERLVSLAQEVGGPAVAITFDPHPAAFLRVANVPPKLTSIERRAEMLSACGVDFIAVCRTSEEWLRQPATEFFNSVLVGTAGAKGIVEGPNFFFGRNREGNPAKLAQLCGPHDIKLRIIEPTLLGEAMVSSSEVRRLLRGGDVAAANQLLTAPYRLTGKVVRGDSRGKQLGFPTANLAQIETMIPGAGVYATVSIVEGRRYSSATHIGPNPTFNNQQKLKVETHLIDFAEDLYGQTIDVEMIAKVREVTKFDSVDDLVQQLKIDVATSRRLVEYSL